MPKVGIGVIKQYDFRLIVSSYDFSKIKLTVKVNDELFTKDDYVVLEFDETEQFYATFDVSKNLIKDIDNFNLTIEDFEVEK